MFRSTILLALVCFATLSAGELVLVEGGKTAYQIVIPEPELRKDGSRQRPTAMSAAFQQTGDLLREAFQQTADVTLEVVPVSKRTPGRPAIVVGGVQGDFAHWEHHVEVRGTDILL